MEQKEMTATATYEPESNKLRLYVGRVPRDEYEKLRAEGWTSTPKQDCDFVATWTPERRDTALEYAGIIEDEDMGPAERAADRAERFSGYREKRTFEATGHADRYDAGPMAHGYQSAVRAERSARRHDRIASRACDAWSKAEYWQRRTAGVISHALHLSSPGVRMGRIKTLEAEQRKHLSSIEAYKKQYSIWKKIEAIEDPEKQKAAALHYTNYERDRGDYEHPGTGKKSHSLWSLLSDPVDPITGAEACALWFKGKPDPDSEEFRESRMMDWARHYELRLAYEHQMLEAQGSRAAFIEMEVGGWIGGYQIRKVNKSPATGRVVSVNVLDTKGSSGYTRESGCKEFKVKPAIVTLNIERLNVSSYRPPTLEDIKALDATIKEEKGAAPKKAPCPLINPTDEDAERLQAIWNAAAKTPSTVLRMTQAEYSAKSSGSYARYETVTVSEHGTEKPKSSYSLSDQHRCEVFKVRKASSPSDLGLYAAHRVVVITDKPQKPIPFAAVEAARAKQPTVESMRPKLLEIQKELRKAWLKDMDRKLIDDASYLGWISVRSLSQISWTDVGLKELESAPKPEEFKLEAVNA